ncbi:MAG: tetratricopeptide repeat protein [Candidatus Omnitrophica bacterium]|nr:tetratricopeptide repeat protein [Candidatus Omnitrophota bacterium]
MRSAIVLSVMLAVVTGPALQASAAAGKQEAISRFVLGNQAYKQGNYDQAVTEYQAIITAGMASGEVYYNLGNAYFKKKQLGLAIANYERALQLIPRDSDVNFNLRHARSLTQKRVVTDQPNLIQVLMDNHIGYYTFDEMVIILTVLVLVLGAVLLLGWIFKWSRYIQMGLRTVIGVMIIMYAVGLWYKCVTQADRAIVLRPVSANFEPREEATSHFDLPVGTAVKVVTTKDGWVKVRRADRRLGWIPGNALEIL